MFITCGADSKRYFEIIVSLLPSLNSQSFAILILPASVSIHNPWSGFETEYECPRSLSPFFAQCPLDTLGFQSRHKVATIQAVLYCDTGYKLSQL